MSHDRGGQCCGRHPIKAATGVSSGKVVIVSLYGAYGFYAGARQGDKSESTTLSAVDWVTAFNGRLDFLDIAIHQLASTSTKTGTKFPSLQQQLVMIDGVSVLCDLSTGVAQALIQGSTEVKSSAVPGLAHLSTQATRRLMAARVLARHEFRRAKVD
jgi:hypothetical protein